MLHIRMCFSMIYVGDDLSTKQQQVLRDVWSCDTFLSFFLSVKCIVAEISFSHAHSGDQEKI